MCESALGLLTWCLIAKLFFFQFYFTIVDEFWTDVAVLSMIHALHHQNNVSFAFTMSENRGLETLIIIIPDILAKIRGF